MIPSVILSEAKELAPTSPAVSDANVRSFAALRTTTWEYKVPDTQLVNSDLQSALTEARQAYVDRNPK